MKKLFSLILLSLTLALPAQAAFNPPGPTLTKCGRQFSDIATNSLFRTLYAETGSGNNTTFRKMDGSSSVGYKPTQGRNFRALCAQIIPTTASQSVYMVLQGTDNDVGVAGSGTAFIGASTIGYDAASTAGPCVTTATLGSPLECALDFVQNNSKYLSAGDNNGSGTAAYTIWGYEE